MAALDTLWFDLDLDDSKLQQKIKTLKSQLSNLGIKLNSAEIEGQLKNVLKNKNINVKVKADTSALESALRKVDELLNRGNLSKTDVSQLNALTRAISTLAREKERDASATDKETASAERNVSAQRSLANAHERVTQGVNSHINANVRLGQSLTGLISFTGDLRNQIGMLISVYTVEHLVKNVVQIGGEFEKQKLAMGSMLGSLEQADDIFNRMKNLALTSPFNFKDLSNYSRQLAAYGTDYKDLYDTTNRLADISAGLGGDMSRLVLAFSQVKAAAYLRGQEMRQFTEFGVALPELLAEKYTKAEGRIVTAGDVIERVSKRMVSFNDVKDVLWQQTDKGGKFYGMQGVLAQSTSGMASNLKDAIDTMYYDIANSNSGVIKGTIKDITTLVGHWRELSAVLAAGTLVYAGRYIVMSVYNRLIGVGTAETIKGVMAAKQEEASILRRKALYGELSAEEKVLLNTSNTLTATDIKNLATSKAISADAVMRMVGVRKITAAQALQIASTVGLNQAQTAFLVKMREIDTNISLSTGFTKMRFQIQKLGMSIRSIGGGVLSNLWSGLKGLFTLPNIAMTGVFIGLDMIMNYNQKQKQIEQDRLQYMKDTEDGAKSLKDFLEANPIELIEKGGNKEELKKVIDAYKEELQNSPVDMSSIITNADAIDDDVKKIETLKQAIIDLKNAKEAASNTGSLLSGMMDKQDGFFSEPVKDNYEDMVKSFSNVSLNMNNITKGEISKTLDYLKKIPYLKNLSSQFDNIKNSGDSVVEMMMQLGRINEQTGGTIEALVQQSGKYQEVLSGLGNTKSYLDDANTFWGQIKQGLDDTAEAYRANGIDLKHTSQQNIDQYLIEVDAQGKALGLQGDNLIKYRLMAEQNLDMRDNMKNHARAWQLLFEEVKNQLIKSKTPIETASKENIIAAEKVAINNLRSGEFGAQLNDALNYISNNLSPIAIRLQIMGGNVNANTLYNDMAKRWRDKYGYIVDLPSYAMPTTEDLGQYRSDLKTNIENSKKNLDTFKKHYGEASRQYKDERERLDNYLAAQSLAGFGGDNSSSSTGGKKGHVGTGGGTKTDTFLKDMQNRLEQVKKAMDVYKKWKDTGISESESIDKMDASGIFAKGTFKNISSENGLNDWYKKTLENLSNAVKKAKYTAERKKYTDSIAELFGEFDQKATKDKFDEYGKYVDKLISDTKTKWDNYQKLLSAGSNRTDAANFAFGGKSPYGSLSEAMASNFYNELAKNNIRKNIDFGMKEEDVKKLLGDGKIAEEMLKLWKDAKEQIEKDRIDIQINADKAKEQISSIADKIKSSIEKAIDQSLGINTSNGKQTKLSEFTSVDSETGLLKLNDNAKDVLSPSQIEDAKNMIASENQEITKLSSQLLELMPAWDDIFGKSAYKSISDITRGIKEIDEIISNAKIINDKNGKASYFTSSYTDANGQTQQIKGNIGELDRLKNQKDTLFGDRGKKGIEGAFTNVFDSLGDYFKAKSKAKAAKANGDTEGEEKANNDASDASHKFAASLSDCIGEMQKWNNALSMLGSTVEAVGGGTGVSDAAGVAGGMLSGAMSMSSLGPWGMAAGAAMGAITGIAGLHDKKLDRAIEKSKQKVQELQNAYKAIEDGLKYHLGNAAVGTFINTDAVKAVKEADATIASIKSKGKLSIFDLMALSKANQTLKENWATAKYLDKNDKDNYGNAYNYQRNLMEQQKQQLESQLASEQDKKKPDQSKINDYKQQISDMESKIANFSEELMSQLYGIDFKGWASQLGDALFAAWQKGESGAEAFKKTANSIIANLTSKFVEVNVIQKAFDSLQKQLYGENGKGGLIGKDNKINDDALEAIDKFFSTTMPATVDAADTLYDKMSETAKKYGYNTKDTTSSSSTTNAISGVSEQEANIIAAYMDAIRQDTYNNRMNLQKIVDSGVKIEESPIMQAQLLQLTQIQSNTYKNMELVGDIKSMFNDVILGNKKIYVN